MLAGALEADSVDALNDAVDAIPPLEPGEWHGRVQRHPETDVVGDPIQLQQIYELAPCDSLVAHPAWIEYVEQFVGNQDDFDTNHGPVYIDENFLQETPQGEGTDIHSGHTSARNARSFATTTWGSTAGR